MSSTEARPNVLKQTTTWSTVTAGVPFDQLGTNSTIGYVQALNQAATFGNKVYQCNGDGREAEQSATTDILLIHRRQQASPSTEWRVRADAQCGDKLLVISTSRPRDLRLIEDECGCAFPKSWRLIRGDGREYLIFSRNPQDREMSPGLFYPRTHVRVCASAPLPFSGHKWASGQAPGQSSVLPMPSQIRNMFPSLFLSGGLSSTTVNRAEFDPLELPDDYDFNDFNSTD